MSDKIQITVKADLYIEDGEELVDQLLLGKLHEYRSCCVDLMDTVSGEDMSHYREKIDSLDLVIKAFTVPSRG